MKLFKFSILSLFAAMVALTSCSEDGYWDGYKDKGTVYSFAQAAISASYTPGSIDAEIPVIVSRNNTSGDVTLPISAVIDVEGSMSVPAQVSFKNGEASATLALALNPDLTPGTYSAELSFDSDQCSVVGDSICEVTITIDYSWVSLGYGYFMDQFVLGSGIYEVEILQAEGFERYRVVNPYNQGHASDDGEWADWLTGKYPKYLEFWTEDDGKTIGFNPVDLGINYEGVAGQGIVAYPYYYFNSTLGNGAYTCWYQEGHACLSPYYYINGVGGWNYTTKMGVIQILLPE